MLNVITKAKQQGLTKQKLTSKTRYLKKKERNEILEDLLEARQIEYVHLKTEGNIKLCVQESIMLKLGINKCDNENYHKDRKFKSSSTLKLFLKDPREYYKRYVVGKKREDTYKSAYDFGSYMHSIF